MKKEEKTGLTKERIINAAMQEFGTNGYAASTLNSICNVYGISKGLLYHNFKGKDELYLICVERCFLEVTAYLREQDIQNDLKKYIELRFRYFTENQLYSRIFFEAVLQPPAELSGEIKQLKKEFDLLNRLIYRSALSGMTLRKGVTEADALEYYEIMQEMFNGYFSSSAYSGKDFGVVIADHEEKLAKILDFMLFGIIERSEFK